MCGKQISLENQTVQVLEGLGMAIGWPDDAQSLAMSITDAKGCRYCFITLQREGHHQSQSRVGVYPQGALGQHTVHVIYDTGIASQASFELVCETSIVTDSREFDGFYPQIKEFMSHDTLSIEIDGRRVYGYRSPDSPMIWLRDHAHQMKGFRYFEGDITSAVEFFLESQMPDGSIYDFVAKDGSCRRVEVEADVEYLLVEAAFRVWQVTGDLEWVKKYLPRLEAALLYSMNSPLRWSKEHGLVKRAFTIDTWDFAYTGGKEKASGKIRENEPFCIMHGDNTGFAQACHMLGRLFKESGQMDKAAHWENVSKDVVENLNKHCWNGRFYTHQVHIDPVDVEGVDENKQLSLSNAYGMNRGVVDHSRCVSIIEEYMERRKTTSAFAEWFSIDPPFPEGSFGYGRLVPGAYVNGGIMPLVGGELARAALEHGFEAYGIDILRRYKDMISQSGETYLWYFPSGKPSSQETSTSPEALPTDGWGSSAMLYAFIEGLAGVVDLHMGFQQIRVAPRWELADVGKATVRVAYGASSAYAAYTWEHIPKEQLYRMKIASPARIVECNLLLPRDRIAAGLDVNGKALRQDSYTVEDIENSTYVRFSLAMGNANIELSYE